MGLVLFLLAIWARPARGQDTWIPVKKVFDGDTLRLSDGEKVRLIGIDAPELHPNEKLYRDTLRTRRDAKTLLKMGKKSYEVMKKLVGKRSVRLEFDQERWDKYHRLLAYVYVRMSEGRFCKIMKISCPKKTANTEKEYMLNREMVRFGWADTFKQFNFRSKEEFLSLEAKAREQHRGLWKE